MNFYRKDKIGGAGIVAVPFAPCRGYRPLSRHGVESFVEREDKDYPFLIE